MTVTCPYCDQPAALVRGSDIYPARFDLHGLFFWRCAPCDAYTGTHTNSVAHAPKGRLANKELRMAKIAAHSAFDPLWKSKRMTRGAAYRWLQDQLGMDRQPHIGFMDVEQCKRVVTLCSARARSELRNQEGEARC